MSASLACPNRNTETVSESCQRKNVSAASIIRYASPQCHYRRASRQIPPSVRAQGVVKDRDMKRGTIYCGTLRGGTGKIQFCRSISRPISDQRSPGAPDAWHLGAGSERHPGPGGIGVSRKVHTASSEAKGTATNPASEENCAGPLSHGLVGWCIREKENTSLSNPLCSSPPARHRVCSEGTVGSAGSFKDGSQRLVK